MRGERAWERARGSGKDIPKLQEEWKRPVPDHIRWGNPATGGFPLRSNLCGGYVLLVCCSQPAPTTPTIESQKEAQLRYVRGPERD